MAQSQDNEIAHLHERIDTLESRLDGPTTTRRGAVVLTGAAAIAALSGGVVSASHADADPHGTAVLIGTEDQQPDPNGSFFCNKTRYHYFYIASDTGARFTIGTDDDDWSKLGLDTGADDSFPGFQTDITTTDFAVVTAAFTLNSTTAEPAVLQASYDGGSTWTTIETHPGGLADKTISASLPLIGSDTVQFRDNSSGSASVSNDDYRKREVC